MIAHLCRLLEFQIFGMIQHLLLEFFERSYHLFLAHGIVFGGFLRRFQSLAPRVGIVNTLDDVLDFFRYADGGNAVREIVSDLLGAAAIGFADGFLHRLGHSISVKNRRAVQVARSAADGLNQRTLGTQKAFLVRIENRDQRYFGQIQTFAQ